MEISHSEAEEALLSIQTIMKKTRRNISASGAYKFLILWGFIWLIGFLNSQFIPGEFAGNIWIGLDILGGILSAFIGYRLNRGIRSSSPSTTGKRIGLFWLLLFLYCVRCILIAGTGRWKTTGHVHYSFCNIRLDCHEHVAFFCISLAGIRLFRPGNVWIFFPARNFLYY